MYVYIFNKRDQNAPESKVKFSRALWNGGRVWVRKEHPHTHNIGIGAYGHRCMHIYPYMFNTKDREAPESEVELSGTLREGGVRLGWKRTRINTSYEYMYMYVYICNRRYQEAPESEVKFSGALRHGGRVCVRNRANTYLYRFV